MKRLLGITALILVIPFLIDASCGPQEEPDPSCVISYDTRWYDATSGMPAGVFYHVINTGNCDIYRVDIYWHLNMYTGAIYEKYTPVGFIGEGESTQEFYFLIYNEWFIEDCSYTYAITDWEGK
jgi:hypothetical protein